MEQVTVEICMGTTCYIMGAAQLANLSDRLPDDLTGRVKIIGMRCAGACEDRANGKPPFAKVNGKLVSHISEERLIALIREELGL